MPPTPIGAEPHTETVEPPEPPANDAPPMPRGPSTPPHAAAPPAAGAPIERRPSPETLRAAIERNLAASADMASLLADSVKAASNGGGHRSTSHASDGEPSAGEPPAA